MKTRKQTLAVIKELKDGEWLLLEKIGNTIEHVPFSEPVTAFQSSTGRATFYLLRAYDTHTKKGVEVNKLEVLSTGWTKLTSEENMYFDSLDRLIDRADKLKHSTKNNQ
jgi:hypothetical protein